MNSHWYIFYSALMQSRFLLFMVQGSVSPGSCSVCLGGGRPFWGSVSHLLPSTIVKFAMTVKGGGQLYFTYTINQLSLSDHFKMQAI